MPEIPTTCAVYVGGALLPDGCHGQNRKAPVVLDGLTLRWGRANSIDQPDPATAQIDILDRGFGPTRVDQIVALGSTLVIEASIDGAPPVTVFAGRITDLDIQWDDAGGGICQVIAADLLADLANRFVGAEPWPQETLLLRAKRIVSAIGGTAVNVTVDARPAALPVSRMDVDRQAAATLLRDLATSGTAALWVVVVAGVPQLRIEDPSARPSMRALTQAIPSLLWVITSSGSSTAPLDACAILRDPIKWTRAIADLITRVTVRWLDPSTSPDPTERTVTLVDSASETLYGARGLSVGTILASSAAADQAAAVLVAGHRPSESWRVTGLVWDLAATPVTAATRDLASALLNNATRIGRPLMLSPLPWWAPAGATAGVYVEGGTYGYRAGRWVLSLDGIPATGTGGSLSYGNTDRSIRYVDVDPAITFLDMVGVGKRANTGPAWTDIAAGYRWNSVPAGNAWWKDPRT